MSHNDKITQLNNCSILAHTTNNDPIAFCHENVISFVFHPEVSHTTYGKQLIYNFLCICRCPFTWKPTQICENIVQQIKIFNKLFGDTLHLY